MGLVDLGTAPIRASSISWGVPWLAGEAPRAVLIGFPTDEGVLRNGGRPGAARGPAEIRRWLVRLTPDARDAARFTTLLEHTADLGDIALTGNLDADQAALGEVVGGQLRLGRFIILLGGGRETVFGHFLGYANARSRWTCSAGAHMRTCARCEIAWRIRDRRFARHWSIVRAHAAALYCRRTAAARGGGRAPRTGSPAWSRRLS